MRRIVVAKKIKQYIHAVYAGSGIFTVNPDQTFTSCPHVSNEAIIDISKKFELNYWWNI